MGITGISGVGTFMEMEYKQSREMGTEEDVEIPCSFFDKKKKKQIYCPNGSSISKKVEK